jgi:hypothetical protein
MLSIAFTLLASASASSSEAALERKLDFTGGFAPGPGIVNFCKTSSDCKLPDGLGKGYYQLCGDDGKCLPELHTKW